MNRERLRTSPVGTILTLSDYTGMVQEEPKILHSTLNKYQFVHWVEHLYSFYIYASGEVPNYKYIGDFNFLKDIISKGLKKSNYNRQSEEIRLCSTEEEMNKKIIRQYTEETNLYHDINQKLRECHNYQYEPDEELVKEDGELYSLAPWILQLNTAIRRQPYFEKKAYRGTNLSKEEIEMYKINELFVWAPFISASKSREACLGGNVLFEIFTESAISEYDKRFARDISNLSAFSEEEEVLFPIACAYRVVYKRNEGNVTVIGIATVDYN